jgi:8-oxo-dGTP pyrophosphatase MutT (NUDIX family)
MAYPPVVIVDEQNRVIGSAPLKDAWAQGLRHRIVMVVVEDDQGRVLLHKRAPNMTLYPDRWDTVGGHVDVTPDYEESARLELSEELGIEPAILTEIGSLYTEEPYDNGVLAKRFITIFKTHYKGDPGQLGEDEATEARWFTKTEVAKLFAEHPNLVSECLYRCIPFIIGSHEDYQHQTTSQTQRPVLSIR